MHLLYCDETNFAKRPGDFFVYGGVAFDGAIARDLADEIEKTRLYPQVQPGPTRFATTSIAI